MWEYVEDVLLNEDVLSLLRGYFARVEMPWINCVRRHVRVGGLEVDAVAELRFRRVIRTVGFELKVLDNYLKFFKAAEQALKRRKHFNYFVVVTEPLWPFTLANAIYYGEREGVLAKLVEEGVGWVAKLDSDTYTLLLPPKYLSRPEQTVLDES